MKLDFQRRPHQILFFLAVLVKRGLDFFHHRIAFLRVLKPALSYFLTWRFWRERILHRLVLNRRFASLLPGRVVCGVVVSPLRQLRLEGRMRQILSTVLFRSPNAWNLLVMLYVLLQLTNEVVDFQVLSCLAFLTSSGSNDARRQRGLQRICGVSLV